MLWLLSALRCVYRRNMWLTQLKAQEADPYCQPMLGLIILLPPIFLVLASSFSNASCNFCFHIFLSPHFCLYLNPNYPDTESSDDHTIQVMIIMIG